MSDNDVIVLKNLAQRYFPEKDNLIKYRQPYIRFWYANYYPMLLSPISMMDNYIICFWTAFSKTPDNYRVITFALRDKQVYLKRISI